MISRYLLISALIYFVPSYGYTQLPMAQTGEPIEVLSDKLEYFDDNKHAVFQGNVLAKQGTSEIYCQKLEVFYEAINGENKLKRMIAETDVLIVTQTGEEAVAQKAEYRPETSQIILTGQVVLKQAKNIISGPKVVIDTMTGRAQVVGKEGQRVRTLLTQDPSSKPTKQNDEKIQK